MFLKKSFEKILEIFLKILKYVLKNISNKNIVKLNSERNESIFFLSIIIILFFKNLENQVIFK